MKKIGIIGAMDIEVSALKTKMTNMQTRIICNMEFASGILENHEVVIVKSGIGKVNAAICATTLILEYKIDSLINTGIAGAIKNGLNILDMVASTCAVYYDMDATGFGYKPTVIPQMKTSVFEANKNMLDIARISFENLPVMQGHKLLCGKIATGDQFIADDNKKQHIKDICDPLCVEMEGGAIAHTCYLFNIPFIIIRTMSDTAGSGDETTYEFNDKTAALMSTKLVEKMLETL